LQKLQVNTIKRITKKNEEKNEKVITNVLVQHISLQLFTTHHQINFSVQMNACTS